MVEYGISIRPTTGQDLVGVLAVYYTPYNMDYSGPFDIQVYLLNAHMTMGSSPF